MIKNQIKILPLNYKNCNLLETLNQNYVIWIHLHAINNAAYDNYKLITTKDVVNQYTQSLPKNPNNKKLHNPKAENATKTHPEVINHSKLYSIISSYYNPPENQNLLYT